ncbi:MAG TPA: copper resistance CopC family protein [Stellaceae bacterium]|nr:copper resistance CopC family protein [Stellaceae bacterium]
MVNHPMIVAAAVLAGAVTLGAPTVQAHAFLDHASPAVGSTVPTAPETMTMWFTQELEPAFTTATVTDASGSTVDAGPAQVDTKDPTVLRVPLKKLSPGTYTVSWHALSVDTHTTTGHFTFEVKP